MAASSDDCISASKQLIELLNTISNGNDKLSEKVCALFEHGAQKDYIDNTGQTYLHMYMRKLQRNFDSSNWSAIVDVLLNHGCDINAQDLNNATPLFLFLCWIPHSPFPGQEDEEEITGWICPTPQQATQVVKKLLSCGSDVNTQGYYNDTPIYTAVCGMNMEICETLLEAGADGNRNSLLGGNSLYALANSDDDLPDVPLEVYTQMVHLLTKKGNVDINMSCIDGSKIIHNATGCCSLNLIDLFVNYGADYKLLDGYGRSVFHYAATNSEPEVLSYFMIRNLDVNSKDVYSYTPLHIACLQGNVEAVSVLLEGGADITATANLGLLPIHLCCGLADVGYRDVEEDKDDVLLVLKVLLKAGADVKG